MIECYYHWCNNHPKDEPFCGLDECTANEEQLRLFHELRKQQEKIWNLEFKIVNLERQIQYDYKGTKKVG